MASPRKETAKLIADIYTGRDPAGLAQILLGEQGMPIGEYQEALKTSSWRPPQTTANLFLSRVRQIVSNLAPGVPSFRSKARVPGAAHLSDTQNRLLRILTDRGDLRKAMRKAGFLGLLSPYFGLKLSIDKDEEFPLERMSFEAVEPARCGYEPFNRRFSWHTYYMQWADLPAPWRPKLEPGDEMKPWATVKVTEVYHKGLALGLEGKGCPMSIFVERDIPDTVEGDKRTRETTDSFGEYTYTEFVPACPLIIDSFLDAAPDEDVPAAEVLSWIPLMRMIVQTLVQIEREIRTTNNTILYDKRAISEKHMQFLQQSVPGARVYLPVDADDQQRGVNATMRPIEQSSELDKYLAALSAYLRLFDDVTGVSPSERGLPSGPRKSAHEAAAITEAAAKRNQDRLEVMAGMWTKIAQVIFAYQREVLGPKVLIPLSKNVVRTLIVPDPKAARFAFDVDPVELGHLSNAGDLQAQMQWLNTLATTQQAFPSGMPRMVREALRRLGNTMGIEDADIYLGAPTVEVGPEERYIKHLQTQEPILVLETDQHDMFMAYYLQMQSSIINSSGDEQQVLALEDAIQMHRAYAARSGAAINRSGGADVIPGVGVGPGEVDNQMAAAFATGGAPPVMPQ